MQDLENKLTFDPTSIDTEFETIPHDTPIEEKENKIDRAADAFVALLITVGQFILAAVLVAFGVSAIPALPFTIKNICKIFVLFWGIKFTTAGFRTKLL